MCHYVIGTKDIFLPTIGVLFCNRPLRSFGCQNRLWRFSGLLFWYAPRLYKGRFTRYDFCLRLSHAVFVARAARVMEKSYTISTISNCLSLRLS